MDDWKAAAFDERVAALYDEDPPRADTEDCVSLLEELAAGGPVLELAIGTGRIGVPLAARGLRVDGIDSSPHMLDKLRAKGGAQNIAATLGNFADVAVEGAYRLIYVVYNTLPNLGTQDEQVRCFENVVAHLTDDGVFVVEAGIMDPKWLANNNQYVEAEHVGIDEVALDVCRVDSVAQVMYENHVHITGGSVRLYPVLTRYIWPSEMDLMARLAGLRLKNRWGGWKREPFTSTSTNNISVYCR